MTTACNLDSSSSGTEQYGISGSTNRPPSVKLVEIVQETIRADRPVMVRIETDDAERDPVTVRFRWLVNDTAVKGESDPTFNSERLKRGDKVVVEATPNDGKHDGTPTRSRAVLVGNTPPVVKVLKIEPSEGKRGDTLSIVLDVWDPDEDEVRTIVKWWRNKQLVAEGEGLNQHMAQAWNRGDAIMVSVVARDKNEQGVETFSEPVILGNSPPQFVSIPYVHVTDGQFEYRAQAVDAEGDPVSYKLEMAPPTMVIDERTGQLRWALPSNSAGSFYVKVTASDDHGGFSFQEFTLSIPQQNAS